MSALEELGSADFVHMRHWVVDRLSPRIETLAKEMSGLYLSLCTDWPTAVDLDGMRASEAATAHLLYLLRAVATDGGAEGPATDALGAVMSLVSDLACSERRLQDVLDTHIACFMVAWRAVQEQLEVLPAGPAEAVGELVGQALLAATARSGIAVSDAYSRARDQMGGAVTPNILGQALRGGDEMVEAMRRAELDGWPVTDPHTVVVLASVLGDTPGSGKSGTGRRLAGALEKLERAGNRLLTCVHQGQLVVAAAGPADSPASDISCWQQVVDHVELPAGHRIMVGLGLTEPGFVGLLRSYRQARRALAVSATRPGAKVVLGYGQVIPQLLLAQDPGIAEDLYRVALGPVDSSEGGGAELLASLQAYLDHGLNVMASAKALLVHRHTVTTRLEKIEQLTGLHIDRSDHRLLLELALRAKQVLEQPRDGPWLGPES